MPEGLSRRTTLLLVAVVFGVTFVAQALLSDRPSAAAPAARASAGPDAPASEPDLRLVAAGTVPPLREPRKPRKPTRKPKPPARKVVKAAPIVRPAPMQPAARVQPRPTAAPRYIPPAPPRSAPAPKAKPKPTPAPASGEFDTSGDP